MKKNPKEPFNVPNIACKRNLCSKHTNDLELNRTPNKQKGPNYFTHFQIFSTQRQPSTYGCISASILHLWCWFDIFPWISRDSKHPFPKAFLCIKSHKRFLFVHEKSSKCPLLIVNVFFFLFLDFIWWPPVIDQISSDT